MAGKTGFHAAIGGLNDRRDCMTELHVHLDGSLRPESVREMAEEQHILLEADPLHPETLAGMLTVPADCRDLNQYLACFDLPLQVLQTPEYVSRAVKELGSLTVK